MKTAKLVCFGRGCDSVEYGGGCYVSGYGTPESPHAADFSRDDWVVLDGTPVIDKRPAIDTDAGFNWVFDGPLVDVDLEDGDCDSCPEPSPIFAEAVAGNAFGGLIAMHKSSRLRDQKRGPLDYVSIREYVEGWRAVGARIGHYEGGQIVWDN